MKKIVLSLAGVLAATAFAPEASALPAFARQTGMACTACHFQHFPVLNSFGRAFRASGYTMMGAQGKIEGEHLSLPDTLNASLLLKMRYQKTSGNDAAAAVPGVSKNQGQWQIPDELGLLLGGRIGENVGFMIEVGGGGVGGPNPRDSNSKAGAMGSFKMPFIYDVGGAKVGVTPFFTDTQGVFFGYEQASGGQVRASRWSEDRAATNAYGFTGIGSGPSTGLAFSASNDMGYAAFTAWTPNQMMGNNAGVSLSSHVLRIAFTPTVADWNMIIGGSRITGNSYASAKGVGTTVQNAAPGLANRVETRATTLDFQAQGQLGGKDTSFYVNYAKAPALATNADGRTNFWNATTVQDLKAWTFAADYSVIPHVLSLAAAYRKGEDGSSTAGQANKNNAITVQAVYDLYQNVALHAIYVTQSGSAYNTGGTKAANMAAGGAGKNLLTFMLEAAW